MDTTQSEDRLKSESENDPVAAASSSSHTASDDEDKKTDGPLQIIEAVEYEHCFKLDLDSLQSLLLDPKIADKEVAVISVAGAFRKGKSFLLNFFLRYLQNLETGRSDWLTQSTDNAHLEGFSWRGGCERETNGILLWRRAFLINRPDGTEVAVLLMDTQGAFDSQSTVKDCATVFALSTMISSMQIYNLSQNIQEDDLQHLQLFTEYGRLALERNDAKPFQSLLFLVRDWSFPYEAEYGFSGGQRILDRRLQLVVSMKNMAGEMVSDRQHPELQQLREHIRSCFEQIECFLMPHPGLKVATSQAFKGQLTDIEDEFKQQLHLLIPRVLAPANLIVKKINGQKVTCRELLEYFKVYTNIFQGEELPEPKSMLLATAEANNLAAVQNSKAVYSRNMEEVCGGHTPYMATEELGAEHERARDAAIGLFKSTRKMGGDEFSMTFLEQLDDEICEAYENFVRVNEGKNLFKSMRTPAVLFVLLVIDYVLQEIFQLFYLNVFATIFSSLLGGIMLTLILWAYARYSGNFREAGMAIDELCDWLWANVMSPLSKEGLKTAVVLHQKYQDQTASNVARKASTIARSQSTAKRSISRQKND